MFNKGDDVFIIDNGRWTHRNEIVIQKRHFVEYTTPNRDRLLFNGETSLEAMSWAVFPTIDLATKFAVAYLIKTECFGETIVSMDCMTEYKKIEKERPDLIFKYMDKVVER